MEITFVGIYAETSPACGQRQVEMYHNKSNIVGIANKVVQLNFSILRKRLGQDYNFMYYMTRSCK